MRLLEGPSGPRNVLFMVTSGRIHRIEVFRRSRIRGPRGVGLGTSQSRLRSLFGASLVIRPEHYDPTWRNVILVPPDGRRNRRIVFLTDGRTVQSMRVGRKPEVHFIEGCA